MRYLKNIQDGCLIQQKRFGFINSIVTKMGTIRPVVVGDRVFGVVVVMDRDINYLLKKYEKPFVKGECISKERRLQIYHDEKKKFRYILIDKIGNEFNLTKDEKKHVYFMINSVDNLNRLNTKMNEESIIAAICFDTKRIYSRSDIKLFDYKVSKKYQLSYKKLYIVTSNLFRYLLKERGFVHIIDEEI